MKVNRKELDDVIRFYASRYPGKEWAAVSDVLSALDLDASPITNGDGKVVMVDIYRHTSGRHAFTVTI